MDNLQALMALANSNILSGMLLVGGVITFLVYFNKVSLTITAFALGWSRFAFTFLMPFFFLYGKWFRPLFEWIGTLPHVSKIPITSRRISDYVMDKSDSIVFDVRTIAEKYWPAKDYPELYQVVRLGLRRAVFDDGKLLGGYDMSMLIDNLYSRNLWSNSIKSGLDAAAAVALGFFIVATAGSVLSITSDTGAAKYTAQSSAAGEVSDEEFLSSMGEGSRTLNSSEVGRAKSREGIGGLGSSIYNGVWHMYAQLGDSRQLHAYERAMAREKGEDEALASHRKALSDAGLNEDGSPANSIKAWFSKSNNNPPLESWGDYKLEREVSVGEYIGNIKDFVLSSVSALAHIAVDLVLIVITSVAVFFLAATILIQAIACKSINDVSGCWREPTADKYKRYRARRHDVQMSRVVFRRALQQDQYVVKTHGDSLIKIGTATGTFAVRGAIGAPIKGNANVEGDGEINIDMEGLSQHCICFGQTGDGKTTAIARPLYRQIISITNQYGNKYGSLCMDAKGVLWRDLKRAAEKVGRGDDVILVGADSGMRGIDPLALLKPADLAAAIRSVMGMTGESKDAFWGDMAAVLLSHVAAVVYAKSRLLTEDQVAQKRYYNIKNIYHLICNEKALTETIKLFKATKQKQSYYSDDFDQLSELEAAINYLSGAWAIMAGPTKTSIVANVSKVLDPIYSNQTLCDKFSSENDDVVSIDSIFDGKLVMLSISSVEHNISAKLLQVLLKTGFYRAARLRELRIGRVECQKKPVVVVIDEAQEIVTADTSGVSDGSFWNVARSGGVCGILITQGIAALRQAMGEAATDNMMQQFCTKIFLRTTDIDTHTFSKELAGSAQRAFSPGIEIGESLEYLQYVHNYEYLDFASKAEEAEENARNVIDNATVASVFAILRNGTHTNKQTDQIDSLFEVDRRFIPKVHMTGSFEGGRHAANPDAPVSYLRDATWRSEDKYREWLQSNIDEKPLLSSTDILQSRWHCFVAASRAGKLVMDIAEIHHEFD